MRGHSSLRGNPTIRHSSGFTLVELVISIILIGMLAAVGSSIIVDTLTTTRMVNADNANTGQARYALERLAREIREIKYAASGVSTCADSTSDNFCIISKTSTSLQFTKTVDGTDITVTISKSGSDLTLNYSSPSVTPTPKLSNQVDTNGFELLYYKIDGTTATSNADIAFVQITLTVKDSSTSGQSISQRTRVALRNA